MTSARIPGGIWSWRRTAVVLVVVLGPVLALSVVASQEADVAAAARLDAIVVSPAILVSAVACYAAWWLNRLPGLAWTTFAVTFLGCQGLTLIALEILDAPTDFPGLWLLAADLAVVVVLLGTAVLARRVPLRPDPVAAGVVVGGAVAVLRLSWMSQRSELGADLPPALPYVVFAIAVIAAGALILRVPSLPEWARLRLAIAGCLVGAAHLVLYASRGRSSLLVTLAADCLAAVALLTTSLALFIIEVQRDEAVRSDLHEELERVQSGARVNRARIHEVNSTIAGIISASRLLRAPHPITESRRHLLEDMIYAELTRLERLMSDQIVIPRPRTVDLDETIRNLVVSQEARGHTVHWTPSGARAAGQPDAVAEVINILLDNAATHGRTEAEVAVSTTDDAVEIVIHDDGPGVADDVRPRIFEWGARGPRSTGQGIGLHIAYELMERQGGYLEVRDAGSGATFVIGLPAVKETRRDGDDDGPPAAAADFS